MKAWKEEFAAARQTTIDALCHAAAGCEPVTCRLVTWDGPTNWRTEETATTWVNHPTGGIADACKLLYNMINQGYMVAWGIERGESAATVWMKLYEGEEGEPPWPESFNPAETYTHQAPARPPRIRA